MAFFSDVYNKRKVLLTGHTGFKGSWMATWLDQLGAEVTGIALDTTEENNHLSLVKPKIKSHIQNIKDYSEVESVFKNSQPEIVFHLAAQSLVRYSYANPLETYETNVMGTANILNACRNTKSVKAVVIITTDKCYENMEWERGYKETDILGGHDPYSNSKACAEHVIQCFRKSFFSADNSTLVASARAGNVIGGGDWSTDRLIPDIVKSAAKGENVIIRSPNSIRPWQHVLESLSGYLLLGQRLLEGKAEFAQAFNFGPLEGQDLTVKQIVTLAQKSMKFNVTYEPAAANLHEAKLLKLDCNKAFTELNWIPVWKEDETISKTFDWYNDFLESKKVITRIQLDEYLKLAKEKKFVWTL